jgi:hypothetical protein
MSPTPWDVPNLLQQGGGGDPETSDHPLTLRCHRNSAGNAGSDLKTPPTTYVESGDLTGCAGGGLRRRQGEETGVGGWWRVGFGCFPCRVRGVTQEGGETALIKPGDNQN